MVPIIYKENITQVRGANVATHNTHYSFSFHFFRCLQLTQKKWFDYTILIFIGINCITLAMERPSIPPKSLERQFLTFVGYVFTVIFTIEMSMKVGMISDF